MAAKLYAVMGATGKIGHNVVQHLLSFGHQVRAIGRDRTKLEALKSQGVEIFQADSFDQKEFLQQAFKGADALFSFLPPSYLVEDFEAYQDNLGEEIKNALLATKVPYVLNLSSIGAHLPAGTGPSKALYRQEQRLNALTNLNLLHLRPSFFMDNIFMWTPSIRNSGKLESPLRSDLPIPFIATQDIAEKVAELLDQLQFTGHSAFELIGPESMTMQQVTKLIGNAISKPELEYSQVPYLEAEKGLVTSGMNEKTAKLMTEMYRSINEGVAAPTQKKDSGHLGRTTYAQFVDMFAEVFKHSLETAKR